VHDADADGSAKSGSSALLLASLAGSRLAGDCVQWSAGAAVRIEREEVEAEGSGLARCLWREVPSKRVWCLTTLLPVRGGLPTKTSSSASVYIQKAVVGMMRRWIETYLPVATLEAAP
jgi:hypothetical protein